MRNAYLLSDNLYFSLCGLVCLKNNHLFSSYRTHIKPQDFCANGARHKLI